MEELYRQLAEMPAPPDLSSARRALDATLHTAEVEGHPGVLSLRSRGHETFLGPNGAIEIRESTSDRVAFTRPGADGEGVWS